MYEKLKVGRYIRIPNVPITPHKTVVGLTNFIRLSPSHLLLEESDKVKTAISVKLPGQLAPSDDIRKIRVSDVSVGAPAGSKAHRVFRFLHYIPGEVTCCKIQGADVLTGPMSGCPLTRFTWGGAVYAGHVGTDGDSPANTAQAKATWNNFANANQNIQMAGFNPYRGWPGAFPTALPNVSEAVRIYGVITPTDFYSVVCYQQTSDKDLFRIAGVKRIPNLPLPQLLNIT